MKPLSWLNAILCRFEYWVDRLACDLPAIAQVKSAKDREAVKDMGTVLGGRWSVCTWKTCQPSGLIGCTWNISTADIDGVPTTQPSMTRILYQEGLSYALRYFYSFSADSQTTLSFLAALRSSTTLTGTAIAQMRKSVSSLSPLHLRTLPSASAQIQ